MSASSKKKLRSENESAKLTERQLAEQKEAKKVKLYTAAFAVVMVLLIVVAAYSGITSSIESSGVHQKNTVAVTVGDHKLSNAELSYYYMDAINNFNSNYGNYAFLYGLDTTVALDQQVYDEETGETWADNFIAQAASSAQAVFALADAAAAEGFTLPAEQKDQLELMSSNLDAYASIYGYSNADDFIKAQYGNGTSKASYLEYYERNILANAYQTQHQNDLTYTAEQIKAEGDANPAEYTSYSYNQYYLSTNRFLTGGTTDESGNTTYTAEERKAAAAEVEAAVNSIVEVAPETVADFDAAISALPVNADSAAASAEYSNQSHSAINTYLTEWVTDASRQAGDVTAIPVTSTSTDENGNEVENVTAYYVVFFREASDNAVNLVNVRHILVSFDGETQEDGSYTDEAKAAAKATADEILNEWKSGEATEATFADLANVRSTDSGSNSNGGLYENVYPGQMVSAFNAWCFDADRKSGDTGIVETEYGYHVMYFVSTADQTYRDYQITNTLRNADMQTWYNSLVDACPMVNGDTQYMRKDIVLSK